MSLTSKELDNSGESNCYKWSLTKWNMSQEQKNVIADYLSQSSLPSSDILPEDDAEVVALFSGIPVIVMPNKFQAAGLARAA